MTVGTLRAPLALLVELLWSYAALAVFVQWFGAGDGPAPSFAVVALAAAGSFGLARLLQRTDLDEGTLRIIGVSAVVGVLFVALRIEYAPDDWLWEAGWLADLITDAGAALDGNRHVAAGVVGLGILCARGITRGHDSEIEPDAVMSSASFGLIAVLVAALTQPDTREPSSWGAYAFAYGIIALVTLTVFRAPEPEQPLWQFAGRWSWGLAGAGGAAFAVALLAAAIDPDAFGFLAPLGDPLRAAGEAFGRYVLAPLFWLISLPFLAVRWVLEVIFGEPGPREMPEPAPPGEGPEADEDENGPLWFRILLAAGTTIGLTLLAGGALLFLWTLFRRYARTQRRATRDRYDTIEPSTSLADDLAGMLGAFARRFRRDPRSGSTVAVRRLYAEMLDDAAAGGLARPPAATPLAFAPWLEAHYASSLPAEISDAFIESRYGGREIDRARVAGLRARWQALPRPRR